MFPNSERLRPASSWQLCAPDKPLQVPIHKVSIALTLDLIFNFQEQNSDANIPLFPAKSRIRTNHVP